MRTKWIAGDEAICQSVESWLETPGEHGAEILAKSRYRTTTRLDLPALDQTVVVKEYLPARVHRSTTRRAIARVRAWLGRTRADAEWTALQRLDQAGVSVPEPLAMARRSGGAALVITRFIPRAKRLDHRLNGYPFEKHRLLRQVGELVLRLHDAGFVHRDLHVGNVLVGENGPLLIDLERCRTVEGQRDRLRDVAFLDFSLHHAGITQANRLRYRIAALGLDHFRVAAERELLREVGRISHARALDYYHGRTRRTLRKGEGFQSVVCKAGSGLRVDDFANASVIAALAAHHQAVSNRSSQLLKCDHRTQVSRVAVGDRSVVVKEVVKTSARKRLADALRGSPGRRAWFAGHGLLIRGIGAARPLAFVERRERGIPVSSAVVLEDLGDTPRLANIPAGDPNVDPLAKQLLRLLLQLHRTGCVHADFQAMHIYLAKHADQIVPTLIDLESVRFPRRLHDRQRVGMLAAINATLADDVLPATIRCDVLERYLLSLPFERGNAHAGREIVRRSLARKQVWRGTDCELSRRFAES